MPEISIIIPVLHEQERIVSLISDLLRLEPDIEIVVVDGDPEGSTLAKIYKQPVVRITATKGRGRQLAAGVSIATGRILLLLHADTSLPSCAFDSIRHAVSNGSDWGAFRLRIDSPGLLYRIIERTAGLRTRLFSLPYGDQAIFATRHALEAIGGIPPIPLMEDVEMALRLRRSGLAFTLLPCRASSSPRRWQQDGIINRTLRNWWLLICYLAGADPHRLARQYR